MEDRGEFVIPRDKNELQVFTENQYSVREVHTVEEIGDMYLNCRTDLETDGADFILEKFEIIYSCLVHFPSVSWEIIHELWDVCLEGMRCLIPALSTMLSDENIDDQLRKITLNKAKMMFYAFSEMMVRCEERIMQDKTKVIPQKGKRKVVEKESQWNWNNQKNLALSELYRFVRLPLSVLWKPNNISEDFLDQMSKCCLKLLEDREVGFVTNKAMRDSIFQILTILCKEYIFGLSLMPKIIQMLMLYEHLAVPLAQSVSQLEEQEGNAGMLKLTLQELNSDLEYLNKAGHNCGQFILELGRSNPKGVCKHLPLVLEHLGRENYNVRMGVIELIGHLLLKVYSEDDLTDQQKEDKEMLYESLFDHLLDVIVFCRSKTLQVWRELCEEEVIPKATLLRVAKEMQHCILDKSGTTRKDAIKLMKTFLEHNPFAARLHSADIENQLTKATEHMKKMERKAGINTDDDPEVFWSANSQEVAKIVYEVLAEEARKKLERIAKGEEKKDKEKSPGKGEEERDSEEEGSVDQDATMVEEREKTLVEEEDEENVAGQGEEGGAAMLQQLLSIADLLRAKEFQNAVLQGIKLVKKFDTQNVLGVAASQGATQREREELLSDLEEEETDEEEEDESPEQVLERKLQRKVRVMHRLMHMACLAQQHQLEDARSAQTITQNMKEELQKQAEYIKFLKESLSFSDLIHTAVDKVLQVLEVSQTTDVAEAIDFIASAQQFGLLTEETGMTCLLSFVHSKDLALKNSITAAYKKIYLSSMNKEVNAVTHEHVVEAMQKVCSLVQKSPPVYERSLKVLIQSWVTSGDINSECVDVLWEMITGKKKEECISAMNVLHMVLEMDPVNVQQHLQYLEKFGFGVRGNDCYELVKNACKVLTAASPKLKSEDEKDPFKISINEEIINLLKNIIVTGIFKLEDKVYCDMVAEAMVAIYKVCDRPADLTGSIIQNIFDDLERANANNEDVDATLTEETMADDNQDTQASKLDTQGISANSQASKVEGGIAVSQVVLARLMEVLTCCMNHLLVFLMDEVLVEMRRQRNMAEKDKEMLKKGRNGNGSGDEVESHYSDSSLCSNASVVLRTQSLTEEEALDRIAHITNVEVLDQNNILGKVTALIEEICQKPKVYTHPGLQVCAIQAMSRCMLLSQQYCSEKLRLFCTLMVKSSDYRVRIAAIHAMADLLRRFPNETDPFSPNLYECLKDQQVVVRREVLVVLSKLILGDMLRVKFQISYLAACLTDPDPSCQDVANYFFATLATKGNILYNLVLDMISQLSSEESDKNQKEFETIMRVILPYIDKERQVVALVEKLCSRFPEKDKEQECYNIALCISILPVTQKSVRALKECFYLYADKIKFVTVKITFDSILQAARKQFKGENKEYLADFQENLDKCSDRDAVKEAVAQMAAVAATKVTKSKSAKKGGRKKKVNSDEESDESPPTKPGKSTKSGRGTQSQRRPRAQQDSSEDSDIEAPTTSRRTQRQTTKRAKPVDSDSESDDAFEEDDTPVKTPARPARTTGRATKTPAPTAKKQRQRRGKAVAPSPGENSDSQSSTSIRRSTRTRSSIRL